MDFKITIEQFEGPLDLMLHLIKENKLDLFDLDISVLSDQYLAYLAQMQQLHLEVASEYLLELATLIEYKSKKLLPKDESKLEEEYEEDPKERLVARLLEYQQYKEVSKQLEQMYLLRQQSYSKPISLEVENWIQQPSDMKFEGSPYDLVKAMNKVLRRLHLSKPLETKFTRKELSMEDRSLQIKARLASLPQVFTFETLIDDCEDQMSVIVTFLAVLDLARQHLLTFTVDEQETIYFSRG
ncbi:MAG: segregation/condensation protein A [Erysipelotrichaceae bacterium]|nr:segregation/condensation protein A [Erysipelotrichaceae bacterium]MDY5251371.1 segregation/condensation protein A [Erysipelotrichaceae bacterium]